MRDKAATFSVLFNLKELELVAFIRIERSTTPLLYAIDTHPRLWGGEEYSPLGGGFSEVKESAEREAPTIHLDLDNRDGVLGPLAHPDAGGEDLRGRRMTIWVLNRQLLESVGEEPSALAIGWTFFVEDYRWVGRQVISFNLGVFPAASIMVPNRTLQGLRCRWIYKGCHCGYTGALPTCDFTAFGPDGCKVHFGDAPMRYSMKARGEDQRAMVV